ncbi:hypothetical protein D3C78_1945200 [compost metagenome]
MHGRGHETVDEDRARFLVHFVLHGMGVGRNFDDHIEGVGSILARGDFVEGHGDIELSEMCGPQRDWPRF